MNRSSDGKQRWWTWRDVFLVRTAGAPSLDGVKLLTQAMVEHRATLAHPMGLVIVLESVTGPPPEAVRKEFASQFDRLGSNLAALAYVIEGTGFAAAAVRALIATTHALQKRPYPQRTTTNVADALRWLLPRLQGGAQRAGELDAALDGLEQRSP